MLKNSILTISLILNGYYYFFHVREGKQPLAIVEKKKVEKVVQPHLSQDKSNKIHRKTTNSPEKKYSTPPKSNKKRAQEKKDEELLFDDQTLALDERIQEKLKYDLQWDDQEIESYQKLKQEYIHRSGSVFDIPPDHDPSLPHYPTYQEHRAYFDTIAEYHEKLKKLLGEKKYHEYERMRRINNIEVQRKLSRGESSEFFFMHF